MAGRRWGCFFQLRHQSAATALTALTALKFCGAVLVTMALVPDVNLLRITGPNAGVKQETIRFFFRLFLGKSLSFAQRPPALTLDLRAGAAAAC